MWSTATLIINPGELDGGTLATQVFAEKSSKPYLVVQADPGISEGLVYLEAVGPHENFYRDLRRS